MPCPKTVGELIEQTWPDEQEAHDLELYLDQWLEAHGGEYPPHREHNFLPTGGALRQAKAPKQRRPKARHRNQLELPV